MGWGVGGTVGNMRNEEGWWGGIGGTVGNMRNAVGWDRRNSWEHEKCRGVGGKGGIGGLVVVLVFFRKPLHGGKLYDLKFGHKEVRVHGVSGVF